MTTIEEASRVFAAANAMRVGDALIDPESGEVYERPEGVPEDGLLEWLMAQHGIATDQEKLWQENKGYYGRAIERLLLTAGVKAHATLEWKSTMYAGAVRKTAKAQAIRDMIDTEEITLSEAKDVIYEAAKDLDPAKLSFDLAAIVVDTSVGRGYVRTTQTPKLAARATHEHYDDGAA